jgi:hypothetical protein
MSDPRAAFGPRQFSNTFNARCAFRMKDNVNDLANFARMVKSDKHCLSYNGIRDGKTSHVEKFTVKTLISDFRHDFDKICGLLLTGQDSE